VYKKLIVFLLHAHVVLGHVAKHLSLIACIPLVKQKLIVAKIKESAKSIPQAIHIGYYSKFVLIEGFKM